MQFRASKLVLSVDPIHWHFGLHSVDIFGVEEVEQGDQLGEVSPCLLTWERRALQLLSTVQTDTDQMMD